MAAAAQPQYKLVTSLQKVLSQPTGTGNGMK